VYLGAKRRYINTLPFPSFQFTVNPPSLSSYPRVGLRCLRQLEHAFTGQMPFMCPSNDEIIFLLFTTEILSK